MQMLNNANANTKQCWLFYEKLTLYNANATMLMLSNNNAKQY